jgi:hypothetical protein
MTGNWPQLTFVVMTYSMTLAFSPLYLFSEGEKRVVDRGLLLAEESFKQLASGQL